MLRLEAHLPLNLGSRFESTYKKYMKPSAFAKILTETEVESAYDRFLSASEAGELTTEEEIFFDFIAEVLNGGVDQWVDNCVNGRGDSFDDVISAVPPGSTLSQWINPHNPNRSRLNISDKSTWSAFETWLYSDEGKAAYEGVMSDILSTKEKEKPSNPV